MTFTILQRRHLNEAKPNALTSEDGAGEGEVLADPVGPQPEVNYSVSRVVHNFRLLRRH